jgi:hypothetical protein
MSAPQAMDPEDMAATNAIFWTRRGWNGSEIMMLSTSPHLTRKPNHTRIRLLSATSVKTITIAYQGIEALYLLLGGLGMRNSYGDSFAFDSLFFPLSVIGLMRIPGALWMTEDYSYADYNGDTAAIEVTKPEPDAFDYSRVSVASTEIMYPANDWRGWIVRILIILPSTFFLTLTAYYLFHNGGVKKT